MIRKYKITYSYDRNSRLSEREFIIEMDTGEVSTPMSELPVLGKAAMEILDRLEYSYTVERVPED